MQCSSSSRLQVTFNQQQRSRGSSSIRRGAEAHEGPQQQEEGEVQLQQGYAHLHSAATVLRGTKARKQRHDYTKCHASPMIPLIHTPFTLLLCCC
jgi:hypothetical protein